MAMRVQLVSTVVKHELEQADRCSQIDPSDWNLSPGQRREVVENRDYLRGTRVEKKGSAAQKSTGFAGSPHGVRSRKFYERRGSSETPALDGPRNLTQHGSLLGGAATCPNYRG